MPAKGQFVDLRTRLERNMQPCPTTGCWLFIGKQDKDGYGNLRNQSGGGDYKAHRIAWETYRGPIPEGLDVAHHCDVRACINPNHLYVATRRQNLADRTARKREPRGEQCKLSKLKKTEIEEIRSSFASAASLANQYGVSKSQIYRIKNRENWNY